MKINVYKEKVKKDKHEKTKKDRYPSGNGPSLR